MLRICFVVNAVHQWERIGLLTLSSVLKKANHHVVLYDIRGKSEKTILRDIKLRHPDVLAYSAMSNEIGPLLRVNRLIRANVSHRCKSIFGGPHPTFFPDIIAEEHVDAVCRGEAEDSLPLYLQYLNGHHSPNEIHGFIIRHDNSVITNPPGRRPENLDDIPFPDRELWDPIDRTAIQKSFFASRGCPYKCAYCFNPAYNALYADSGAAVRRRSVDNFLSEIKDVLVRYSKAYPFFDDDSFLMAPLEWLEEFSDRYRREVRRPFGCNVRADQVTEEKVRILAGAGWHYCWFGIECGDEEFANRVLHRRLSNEQIRSAARLLHSYKIWFATQNINALPSDRPVEIDEKTLRLNLECRPGFAMAHIFYPFPGTELAEYSRAKGLFDGDLSRLGDPLCLRSPLGFDRKRKNELERQSRLFGTVVAFPWLRRFLPGLRKLPLGWIYSAVYFLQMGYCTRIKLWPARKGFRYYASMAGLLVRRLAQACRYV
jgi:radical SAM superfamily enzyme YgiQ (UPF0313 family)